MWSQSGTKYSQYNKSNELDFLPPGIYTLEYGPFGSMFLNLMQEKFVFPYKLYGEDGFPERVLRKYQNSTSNLGVMLCGLKGTGKTVQAEQICNLSGLPVILVKEDYNKGADLIHFLASVDQEVVVFIDEYEKIFGKSDVLLSIMDGALNAKHRRIFVLTANTPYISDAMIDRPSRVHYLKRFGNLGIPVIGEVVDDMLEDPSLREEVIEYLAAVDIVTIDIVKTVVSEVNLFGEPPQKFKDFLNVTVANHQRWDILDSEGTVLMTYATCRLLNPFMKGYDLVLQEFNDKGRDFGYITAANSKTGKIVTDQGTFKLIKSQGFAASLSQMPRPIHHGKMRSIAVENEYDENV